VFFKETQTGTQLFDNQVIGNFRLPHFQAVKKNEKSEKKEFIKIIKERENSQSADNQVIDNLRLPDYQTVSKNERLENTQSVDNQVMRNFALPHFQAVKKNERLEKKEFIKIIKEREFPDNGNPLSADTVSKNEKLENPIWQIREFGDFHVVIDIQKQLNCIA
jgi:hypothetical protein